MKLPIARMLSAFVATIAPATTAMAQQGSTYHPHYWGEGWGWGGMILGPLMMILFIALIVVVVVLAVRWLGGAAHLPAAPPGRTPLDILKERFARGEIDKADFEERRRTLGE